MLHLLNQKSRTITGAALLLGAASFLSRILGVFRDRILAGMFGAGDTLDIYYASFRIPDFVYNLVILGTISAVFIPIFTEKMQEKTESGLGEHWKFAANLLNVLGIFLIIISAFLFLFANPLVSLITPGFSEEKRLIAVSLTRLLFLSPIFLGLSGIFGGILQAHQRFLANSLSPILYNLGIIFGALFLTSSFGIYGLGLGVIIGAFLHLVVQIPPAIFSGFRWQWILNLKDKALRRMLVFSIPRILTLAVNQVNFFIVTIIASGLISGSLTVFTFANNMQSLPLGIIGISFATAAFPTLAVLASNGNNRKEFLLRFTQTLRQIIFYITPAAVLLLVLRAQIVRVILGTGEFDWADTIMTADSLAFFALSLVAQALIPLFIRCFYALKNFNIPLLAAFIGVSNNIIFSLLMAPKWGVAGLAFAFSLSAFLNLSCLFIALRAKIEDFFEFKEIVFCAKIMLASIFMVFVVQTIKYFIAPLVDMQTGVGILTQGFAAGILGLIVYLAFCYLVRIPETKFITRFFHGRR